jgi:flagellar assembly factor FliW
MTETELKSIEQEILDHAFEFPLGIVGFASHHRYVFAQTPEERPFAWMRSLDDAELKFAVVDAFYLNPDYSVYLDDEELRAIGSPTPMDCFILFILRIEPGPPFRIYANMRAPLVLNRKAKKGMQCVIPDSPYPENAKFEFE